MTNQQGAPEALRLAEEITELMCSNEAAARTIAAAADELCRLHYENKRLAALVEAQQPATHVQNPAEIEHVAGDVSKTGPESNMTQQPAPSAAATGNALPEGWVPLVIVHEGQYPEEVAYGPQILMDRLGKWLRKYFDHVVASKAQPSPTPQADSQPDDKDLVAVPRDLIGAACSAIDKKRDGAKTLTELRRYTIGDHSIAIASAPQADSQPTPVSANHADLPPLPDPDMRDVGTAPEASKNS